MPCKSFPLKEHENSVEEVWRPWRESNPHLGLRSALLYPLSYGGVRHGLYRALAKMGIDRQLTDWRNRAAPGTGG